MYIYTLLPVINVYDIGIKYYFSPRKRFRNEKNIFDQTVNHVIFTNPSLQCIIVYNNK